MTPAQFRYLAAHTFAPYWRRDAARFMGVDPSTLSRWTSTVPPPRMACRLLRCLALLPHFNPDEFIRMEIETETQQFNPPLLTVGDWVVFTTPGRYPRTVRARITSFDGPWLVTYDRLGDRRKCRITAAERVTSDVEA